jgi:hypothetical protein
MIRLGGLMNQKAFGKFEMGKVISNPFATAFVNEAEGEDHEVSMANNSLDTIIKMATELKAKMGENEKDIPAWIQDHITNAENFISQASSNYHEYGQNESRIAEDKGPCWKGYQQIGMKEKDGRQVPNCVPNESVVKEGRSVRTIQTDYSKTIDAIQKELVLYKKHKGTSTEKKHIENLKKLNVVKKKLEAELNDSLFDDPLASKAKVAASRDINSSYGPYNYDFD